MSKPSQRKYRGLCDTMNSYCGYTMMITYYQRLDEVSLTPSRVCII